MPSPVPLSLSHGPASKIQCLGSFVAQRRSVSFCIQVSHIAKSLAGARKLRKGTGKAGTGKGIGKALGKYTSTKQNSSRRPHPVPSEGVTFAYFGGSSSTSSSVALFVFIFCTKAILKTLNSMWKMKTFSTFGRSLTRNHHFSFTALLCERIAKSWAGARKLCAKNESPCFLLNETSPKKILLAGPCESERGTEKGTGKTHEKSVVKLNCWLRVRLLARSSP